MRLCSTKGSVTSESALMRASCFGPSSVRIASTRLVRSPGAADAPRMAMKRKSPKATFIRFQEASRRKTARLPRRNCMQEKEMAEALLGEKLLTERFASDGAKFLDDLELTRRQSLAD